MTNESYKELGQVLRSILDQAIVETPWRKDARAAKEVLKSWGPREDSIKVINDLVEIVNHHRFCDVEYRTEWVNDVLIKAAKVIDALHFYYEDDNSNRMKENNNGLPQDRNT